MKIVVYESRVTPASHPLLHGVTESCTEPDIFILPVSTCVFPLSVFLNLFKALPFLFVRQHAPLKGSAGPVWTHDPLPGSPSVEGGEDEGGAAGSDRGGLLL